MLRGTKKVIIMLICGMVLFTQPVFAMGNTHEDDISYYKHQLDEMAKDDDFDLVGIRGEQLYFDLRDEYSQGNPLKQVKFDAMTLTNQYKLSAKAYRQNDLLYDIFFIGGGVRYAVKSGKMAWRGTTYLDKALKGADGLFKALRKF